MNFEEQERIIKEIETLHSEQLDIAVAKELQKIHSWKDYYPCPYSSDPNVALSLWQYIQPEFFRSEIVTWDHSDKVGVDLYPRHGDGEPYREHYITGIGMAEAISHAFLVVRRGVRGVYSE